MDINKYVLKRYHQRMELAKNILGGHCIICNTVDNLEIDHINPDEKSFTISELWSVPIDRFYSELAKCQLLCKKHHKEKHSVKNQHGTLSTYRYCKCDLCRKAKSDYMRDYRKKKKLALEA